MTDEQANQILKEPEMLRKLKMIELFDKVIHRRNLPKPWASVSRPSVE
jgi:hypothetical protein